MKLYSLIYTEIELLNPDLEETKKASLSAYYAVVSHVDLNDIPIFNVIYSYIKSNKEKSFGSFNNDLALLILLENKLHNMELDGDLLISHNGIDRSIENRKTGQQILLSSRKQVKQFLGISDESTDDKNN